MSEHPSESALTTLAIDGRSELALDGEFAAWLVEQGSVNVFAVAHQGGNRHLLCERTAGHLLLATPAASEHMSVVGVGRQNTRLVRLDTQELTTTYALQLGEWIDALAATLAPLIPVPDEAPLLETHQTTTLEGDRSFRLPIGYGWLRIEQGKVRFAVEGYTAPTWLAVSHRSAITTLEYSKVTPASAPSSLTPEEVASVLTRSHRDIYVTLGSFLLEARNEFVDSVHQAIQYDRARASHSYGRMLSILLPKRTAPVQPETSLDPLVAAFNAVIGYQGVRIPPKQVRHQVDPIRHLAHSARVRVRRLHLEEDWWRQDCGPVLGTWRESGNPIALIPVKPGVYDVHDPTAAKVTRLSSPIDQQIDRNAYMFYRPLPEGKLSWWKLVRFGFSGLGGELRTIIAAGLAVAVLGLLTPILSGELIDVVVVNADLSLLAQLTLGLVVAAVAAFGFSVVRSLAVLRLEGRMSFEFTAAIWDRLLRLPLPFFGRYRAGDLASRAGGIIRIRQTLSTAIITSMLSGVFSCVNFFLLVWYSLPLTLVALPMILIPLVVGSVATMLQLSHSRDKAYARGQGQAMLFEIIQYIGKIRASATENLAFARWCDQYYRELKATFRYGVIANVNSSFDAGWAVLSALLLYSVTATFLNESPDEVDILSAGTFVTFIVAFNNLSTAIMTMISSALSVTQVIPDVERLRPILAEPPEVPSHAQSPGSLSGAIDFCHVRFRYEEKGPLILDDIDLRIEACEFLAIVGPSGAGKSSFVRLLLGFETPQAGTILFDEHPLESLDKIEVRRQMGVVLQNGFLFSGTIFSNIVGTANRSLDEAWQAARMAGIDQEIRQLPMQMRTFVGEEGSNFSGGQRQRILIARALINHPRILIFDEATSALDNQTQRIVTESLANLPATRIVVAHRLSTIRGADRIVVLDGGKLIQQGTYEELVDSPGLFRDLARRQLL